MAKATLKKGIEVIITRQMKDQFNVQIQVEPGIWNSMANDFVDRPEYKWQQCELSFSLLELIPITIKTKTTYVQHDLGKKW